MRSNNVYLNNLYTCFMDEIYAKQDSVTTNDFPELIELPVRALKKARDISRSIAIKQQKPYGRSAIYSVV